MSYILEMYLEEHDNDNVFDLITENTTKEAQQWFDTLTSKINAPRKSTGQQFKGYRTTNAVLLGRVYAYKYDPKHRATLPFFDENPLVIPFAYKDGVGGKKGFLGINLHFLPRRDRKTVMNFFMKQDLDNVMKTGYIPINYGMIKNNSRFALLQYCIRMYLVDHVRGMFYLIPQSDYIKIIDLYSGKYVGMSEQQIIIYLKQQKSNSVWRITKTGYKKTKTKFNQASKQAKNAVRTTPGTQPIVAPVPHVEKEPAKYEEPKTMKTEPKPEITTAKPKEPAKFDVLPTTKKEPITKIKKIEPKKTPKAKDITQNPNVIAPKVNTNLVTTNPEAEKPKFEALPGAKKQAKKPKIKGNIKP